MSFRRVRLRPLLLVVLAVATVACGGGSDPVETLAAQSCEDLEQAGTPIERRLAETELERSVDEQDVELADVLGAMQERCPDVVDDWLADPGDELEKQVELDLDRCTDDEVNGTVTNRSDVTVRIRVETRFLGSGGTLLDTSTDVVDRLEAGETGEWSTSYFGDDDVARCESDVTQVVQE